MSTDTAPDAATGTTAGALIAVPARIWYVVRPGAEEGDPDRVHLAFPNAACAAEHAARASAETGRAHHVLDMPFLTCAPEPVTWHHLRADISLTGARLWTTTTVQRCFPGADDAPTVAAARWHIITREAISLPQSRVRLDITGHSQSWCASAVKTCWDAAVASPEYATARQVEDMFRLTRLEN